MFAYSPPDKGLLWRTAIRVMVVGAAVGCSSLDSSSGVNKDGNADASTLGPPPYNLPDVVDGGDGAASGQRGNALCRADALRCYPDGTRSEEAPPCTPERDAGAPADGGVHTDDALACHVRLTGTECLPAGAGRDNALCTAAKDCSPGFECVTSGLQGRCRHYCCDGRTSCEATQFCDIQPTKEAKELVVPVCMPLRKCELLKVDNGCSITEDCSIVDENDGTTSCVTVGPAGVGENCSQTHCGKGLACLGQSGQRKCYQLCEKSNAYACSPNERCVGTAPLFQNSNVGICSSSTR